MTQITVKSLPALRVAPEREVPRRAAVVAEDGASVTLHLADGTGIACGTVASGISAGGTWRWRDIERPRTVLAEGLSDDELREVSILPGDLAAAWIARRAASRAALKVGDLIEDADRLLRAPAGALLINNTGDPVLVCKDDIRTVCLSYDEDGDGWEWDVYERDGRATNAVAWPLRVVALGQPEGAEVAEAARAVRRAEVARLRAEGERAVLGGEAPRRAAFETIDDDDLALLRLADGTGWEVCGDGEPDGWDWDTSAALRVLAEDLTDEEIREIAALDGVDEVREWAKSRGAPRAEQPAQAAQAAPGAPPRAGHFVPLESMPPGSICLRCGAPPKTRYLARLPGGGGWHISDDLAGFDVRELLSGSAVGWAWPPRDAGESGYLLATGLRPEDFRDRAKLERALRGGMVEVDMPIEDLPPGCIGRADDGWYIARSKRGGWWFASGWASGTSGWNWSRLAGDERRCKIVAGGVNFDALDAAKLAALLGDAPAPPGVVGAEGPKAGAEVRAGDAPTGWLLADERGRAWARFADGSGRLLATEAAWCGFGARWPWSPSGVVDTGYKPKPDARLRLVAPLGAEPAPTDDQGWADLAWRLRAALWRAGPHAGRCVADALALAAGTLGPRARRRLAGAEDAESTLILAVPWAMLQGVGAVAWAPGGPVAYRSPTAAAAVLASRFEALQSGALEVGVRTLADLSGARAGSISSFLSGLGGLGGFAWTSGGVGFTLQADADGAYRWQVDGAASPPLPTRADAVAGLIDALLDSAICTPPHGGIADKAWIARAPAKVRGPVRFGPAVAAPGRVAVVAATDAALARAQASAARAERLERSVRPVRGARPAVAPDEGDAVRTARAAVAALDAAGLLP